MRLEPPPGNNGVERVTTLLRSAGARTWAVTLVLAREAARVLAGELRSLRGRLLYAFTALLLILAVLEVEQHVVQVRRREHVAQEAHARAADVTASTVRAYFNQFYRLERLIGLTLFSGRFSAGTASAPAVNLYLQDIARQYNLASIQVVELNGQVRYSWPEIGATSVAQEAWFTSLRQASTEYISGIEPNPVDSRPRVRLASLIQPLPGDSALRGLPAGPIAVVSVQLDPATLPAMLINRDEAAGGGRTRGRDEVFLLFDPEGQVVNSAPATPAEIAAGRDGALAQALQSRRGSPVKLRSPEGGLLLGYAAPIGSTGWTVAYCRPEASILSAAGLDTSRNLGVIAAVVLLFTLVTLLILSQSLRPLTRLSAAAKKLGTGDLTFRIPPAEVREFEGLVDAFNQMSERLGVAQAEIERHNRRLEQLVRERTRQLEAEHQKVLRSERLSTLGLLSSAIAHDLRNPLNTVTLTAHWLKMRLSSTDDTRVLSRLEAMDRELRRADQIIKTLLEFARTGEPNSEPADINALLAEVVDVVRHPTEVTVTLDLDSELPAVSIDRAQIFQVVENLVRNGIEAVGAEGTLRVASARAHDQCVITVSDTGPGIPREIQASIFEPLVTTRATGTGLGLALCKRIVDAHGGSISVESTLGEGATFRIDLPLVELPVDVTGDAPSDPEPASIR